MKLDEKYQKKLDKAEKYIDDCPDKPAVLLGILGGILIRLALETQQQLDELGKKD